MTSVANQKITTASKLILLLQSSTIPPWNGAAVINGLL